MIVNPRLAPTEALIDAVDPEELKFALAFREAVFTGRTPPGRSVEWFGAESAEFLFPDTPDNRAAMALLGHCGCDREKFFALMTRIEHLFSLLESAQARGWASIEGSSVGIHDAVLEAASKAPMHLTRGPDEEGFFEAVEALAHRVGSEQRAGENEYAPQETDGNPRRAAGKRKDLAEREGFEPSVEV
jgi:hypothetical protein